jgi:hypothetical protein
LKMKAIGILFFGHVILPQFAASDHDSRNLSLERGERLQGLLGYLIQQILKNQVSILECR